ncbi:MAG: glycosyltransferase [Syntrophobacterales bacterium]|nr:glycosyltransferase [Syntrophobacterales bacterium]
MGSRDPAQVLPHRRLRVLQLISTLPVGGAEEVVAAIVRGLNPELFEVEAATLGTLGAIGEELRREGYRVTALNLPLKRTPALRLIRSVRRLLRDRHPEILHTHLYHPNLYGRLAAWGLGLPVVCSVHNVYTRIKGHRLFLNRLLVPLTDVVLAVSPQVWADIRRYDGVPPEKLLLLPNGVDLRAMDLPESREEARARLQVDGFVIGAVGRLEEAKGHTWLLEALRLLGGDLPELTLLVAGEGRLEEALRRQAADLGLEGRVRFLGWRRDVPLILKALDLYVQPSLWEGLSLALLQAMAAGLPVVATRIPGFEQVITSGVNGVLVPPRDAAALAAAIRELKGDPATRARLGEAARRTVSDHYSQETMLHRLQELYLELWGNRRRS